MLISKKCYNILQNDRDKIFNSHLEVKNVQHFAIKNVLIYTEPSCKFPITTPFTCGDFSNASDDVQTYINDQIVSSLINLEDLTINVKSICEKRINNYKPEKTIIVTYKNGYIGQKLENDLWKIYDDTGQVYAVINPKIKFARFLYKSGKTNWLFLPSIFCKCVKYFENGKIEIKTGQKKTKYYYPDKTTKLIIRIKTDYRTSTEKTMQIYYNNGQVELDYTVRRTSEFISWAYSLYNPDGALISRGCSSFIAGHPPGIYSQVMEQFINL